jgi:hypothetical protein
MGEVVAITAETATIQKPSGAARRSTAGWVISSADKRAGVGEHGRDGRDRETPSRQDHAWAVRDWVDKFIRKPRRV